MPKISENEIVAMGAVEALRQGYLRVVGKATRRFPAHDYLLIVTSSPNRACTYDQLSGITSPIGDLQIFYKFGAWYNADHFDEAA